MKIQVNSDRSVDVNAGLTRAIEERVSTTLSRYSDRLTRVEVHLSDINGERFGTQDKRCVMEARPTGLNPVSVTGQAANVDDAVKGASQKMLRLLRSQFEKKKS
jgi:ribosome-associated translation inhibitor RaiA